jgi:excisionase family DNA binding protein
MMPKLWAVQDVAEYLGVPVATLYQWRTHGQGPAARKVGKYLRYKPDDVMAWFDAITTDKSA